MSVEYPLVAPFPWFGGKSRAADVVWQALGNVDNYVEPFAGLRAGNRKTNGFVGGV